MNRFKVHLSFVGNTLQYTPQGTAMRPLMRGGLEYPRRPRRLLVPAGNASIWLVWRALEIKV